MKAYSLDTCPRYNQISMSVLPNVVTGIENARNLLKGDSYTKHKKLGRLLVLSFGRESRFFPEGLKKYFWCHMDLQTHPQKAESLLSPLE